MKRIVGLAFFMLMVCAYAFGQNGEITGAVLDESGEGIPFANVSVERNGIIIKGTQTDFDGNFTVKPLEPGDYDVKVSYVGKNPVVITGVQVRADQIRELDVNMSSSVTELEVVEIIEFKVPLIDKNSSSTKQTITQEQIAVLPTRNVNTISSQTAGAYQSDEGEGVNFKGGRQDANEYYIDGVKVRGSVNLPSSSIEQITVVTGGVPAKYGDAIGGVISITTRGPSRNLTGEVEVITSQFLDPYGYNLANFSLSGPLAWKNKGQDNARPLIGFRITGEYQYDKDPDPSAVGVYKVNDDLMTELEQNPLIASSNGSGFILNSETVTLDDLEKIDAKENVAKHNVRATMKLDFKVTDKINIAFGGNYSMVRGYDWIERYGVFNSVNNDFNVNQTYRMYGRIQQSFGSSPQEGEEETPSIIQNAYYQLQFDYTRVYNRQEDDDHGFDPFRYGYVGEFVTQDRPVYGFGTDEQTGLTGWLLQGYTDTLVEYRPGTINPTATAYTTSLYNLAGATQGSDGFYTGTNADAFGLYSALDFVALNNGLRNGDRPNSHIVHGVWYNTGRQFNGYGYNNDDEQYRLRLDASFDIVPKHKEGKSNRNKHAIEFGFEFEQRVDRFYSISPVGLWTLMRQLTNSHISDLDLTNPTLVINGQEYAWDDPNAPAFGFADSIIYDQQYVAADQSVFDANLREKLGLPVNGVNYQRDWIDIDALAPETFSLDMFSADELWNQGSNYVNYSGYDYLGNRLTNQPAFEDFWRATDDQGNYTRPVGAFRPIYTAVWVQDVFLFKDLQFNVGMRVDRFDANQKVLKDRFSLYEIYTVEEAEGLLSNAVPGNMGSDFAVYVDDFNSDNPTAVGYRDGDTWYNAAGDEITDPSIIESSSSTGRITPFLISSNVNDIKDENFDPNTSFEDYDPQVTFMPRIQFSFNLTDEASFFAHYDVLTQRPQSRIETYASQWYYFEENSTSVLNNPNLRPEKTIDYQIGFRQKVTQTSAMTISAFYREMRDMIQVIQVNYAYPNNYTTFGNQDFGTVKGFSLAYDLRRTKNISLRANYTLQFASGTGSNTTSQLNLLNAGNPNLRTIVPLSFDSRHLINVVLDYSYGEGENYNGPKIKGKNIFENAGINLTVNTRSGEPFTKQSNATAEGLLGVQDRTILSGEINGNRLPWHTRVDVRIYKDILLNPKADPEQPKFYLNVYFLIQNLLNTQNVLQVYSFTGNPDDDGYLSSDLGQQDVDNRLNDESFVDLYSIYVNRPDNYSLPRRIRLGAIFSF